MNAKKLTAALVLFAAAGTALAESPYPPETKFVSTKTRAEVMAELQEARDQGLITNGNDYPIPFPAAKAQARERTVVSHAQSAKFDSSLYSGA